MSLTKLTCRKRRTEKAWLRVKSKDLDSSEVEDLILDTELLTPLQQQRKKKEVEMEKKRLEQLPPEEREEKQEERKTKAKHKLAQRLAREALANHAKEQGLQKVPHQFEDEVHYIASFMPLYFRECQAQIQRCKDSEMLKEAERVRFHAFRLEEPFVKLELLRTKEACTVTQYSGQDLVLLTQEEDLSKPHHVHLLGLVDHSVMQNVHLTVCVDMASKPGSRMKEVANLIAKEAPWYMVKVTSMSTQIREFEGMKALPEIFLKETILNREDVPGDEGTEMQAASALELGAAPKLRLDERTLVLPEAMEQWLQSRYNESQQNAIRDSQKVQGITLVQGPPGTGKTTTVMAIIAGLLGANRQARQEEWERGARRGRLGGLQ
ncbi:unnamed protein product [Effrenium voratum]|uniref:DNA2/NAM7 helicase helicase domain-containing protein n=1 Tax=Effrenium voratum TaxID=2562239 RepID=A0AA36HN13_9DINO|nr:unnamed protein product [Effrenium voratum]